MATLISDVTECVVNMFEVDRDDVVSKLADHLAADDSFTGGFVGGSSGVEGLAVESAINEVDTATWQAAVDAASQAVVAAQSKEAKELAIRLIRALAATATKKEATSAA